MLARFIAAFKRGIEGEVSAMRDASESFDVPLLDGEDLGGLRYSFATTERLVAGTPGVLKAGQRVVIERVVDGRVTLSANAPIDVSSPCALVMAPWFLYDRLVEGLERIEAAPLGMTLFGREPPVRSTTTLVGEHAALNASQRGAVQLCAESNLAFIWGPPGTGKTATLVRVIEELLARNERILIASTTNAAIDQLLAKLAPEPWFSPGTFVRIGRSDADTFGAELADIVDAQQGARRDELARLRSRIGEAEQQIRYARSMITELTPALSTQQSLFAAPPPRLRAAALARVFAAADEIAGLDARGQLRVIEQRIARLERVRTLAKARVAVRTAEARDLEARVVANARVVLCTLANTYVSPLLANERFDVLIAEEAGMATLPPLFYAASRCERRAIMVGDPRQLPPIVQSNDDVVRRSIGRSIFELTARPEVMAMLDVQYRMHPMIGSLVGTLFYEGRLVHEASGVEEIAARAPFPGKAVVVVDTKSTCERSGTSRINRVSGERTAALALEAVRGGSTSVAVITPYAAQAAEIRKLLAAHRIADVVECSTIHRFQGRECDVVLIDLVDAHPMRPSALVGEAPNLLNVSISRARGKLVITADVQYFETMAPDGLVARLLRAASAA